MKENYRIQLTLGHAIFIVLSLLVGGFLDFYLGARFGPELLWGIKVDRLQQETFLPGEVAEAELESLLKEEGSTAITFHSELEKKTTEAGVLHMDAPLEIPDSVKEGTQEDLAKKDEKTEAKAETPKEIKIETKTALVVPSPEEKPTPTPENDQNNSLTDTVSSKSLDEVIKQEDKKPVVATPKPEVKEKPAPVEKVEKKPEPKPEVVEAPAKPVNPFLDSDEPVEEPAPVANTGRRYTLQVGSYSSLKQAQTQQSQFESLGYTATIKTEEIPSKGTWYRVRVGSYADPEAAETAKTQISQKSGVTPVVIAN